MSGLGVPALGRNMVYEAGKDEEQPNIMRSTVINDTRVLPNAAFRTPEGKIVL